jgi:hypothetical protein
MPDARPAPRHLRPALTAAAQAYTPQDYRATNLHRGPWQDEAWYFYDTLGEFSQAVDWRARGMSRIALVAAEIVQEGSPQVITEGPAAQLMAQFCGGAPGQSAFLQAITPHLDVPGEGWLVAERASALVPLGLADWVVYATESIQTQGADWRVQVGDGAWKTLPPESLPMRIWQPHPRRPWLARSSAEAAVPIMRRIELIDKRIIAMMVSRLAMNGLLLIPQEGTFDVPAQYAEAPDPFVAMLIDIAGKNIADPGRASAGIPIPVKFTSELIEKWRLLKPEDPLDEWLLKEREDELGRLGDALSISRERVTGGTGSVNHWGSWQLAEEEVRLSFAPTAELICAAISKSFLLPALLVSGKPLVGPNGGIITAWYDTSELIARPDLAAAARDVHAVGGLSDVALRRESGFDESDAPTPEEFERWVWIQLLKDPNLAPTAVQKLTGTAVPVAAPPAGGSGTAAGPVSAPASPAGGIPPTRSVPPPSPAVSVPAVAASARGRVKVSASEANGHGR